MKSPTPPTPVVAAPSLRTLCVEFAKAPSIKALQSIVTLLEGHADFITPTDWTHVQCSLIAKSAQLPLAAIDHYINPAIEELHRYVLDHQTPQTVRALVSVLFDNAANCVVADSIAERLEKKVGEHDQELLRTTLLQTLSANLGGGLLGFFTGLNPGQAEGVVRVNRILSSSAIDDKSVCLQAQDLTFKSSRFLRGTPEQWVEAAYLHRQAPSVEKGMQHQELLAEISSNIIQGLKYIGEQIAKNNIRPALMPHNGELSLPYIYYCELVARMLSSTPPTRMNDDGTLPRFFRGLSSGINDALFVGQEGGTREYFIQLAPAHALFLGIAADPAIATYRTREEDQFLNGILQGIPVDSLNLPARIKRALNTAKAAPQSP